MGGRREGGQGAAQVTLGCVGCSRITGTCPAPSTSLLERRKGGARPPRLVPCCDQLQVGCRCHAHS